ARSRLPGLFKRLLRRWRASMETRKSTPVGPTKEPTTSANPAWIGLVALLVLLAALSLGAWKLVELLGEVSLEDWGRVSGAAGLTLGRVLLATALGTLWALPAGLAIGLSPRLSRILQPVVQVLASFPAPMLFPLVI